MRYNLLQELDPHPLVEEMLEVDALGSLAQVLPDIVCARCAPSMCETGRIFSSDRLNSSPQALLSQWSKK